MKIVRLMLYDETNSKEQLLDEIQLKVMCLNALGISVCNIMGTNTWGGVYKTIRNIKVLRFILEQEQVGSIASLAEQFEMSKTRLSAMLRKVNRFLRFHIQIHILRKYGQDLPLDIDQYITLIAMAEYTFPALSEISTSLSTK